MSESVDIRKGLVGVVVDTTAVSKVMQDINALTYRGYAVQDLAEACRFEEVAYLLLKGTLPTAAELAEFNAEERNQRGLSETLKRVIDLYPKGAHPMDMVRTAVSFLGMEDPETEDNSPEAELRKAMRLYAKLPTIVARALRNRRGQTAIEPDAELGYSENVFHMHFGDVPQADIVKAFDVSMTLYAEHSFNASTFTARVIASSNSDLHAAVTGAIGSLKGNLHGGANEAVMYMLQEVAEADRAESWMVDALAQKRKIMGFGHRVYKKGDSRVPTMRKYFEKIAKITSREDLIAMENGLAAVMLREKDIHPNLDFPAGPTYFLMGFDIDFFTPLFVMSRVTGWAAHVFEQHADNRLIRPLSAYTGPNGRPVPALEQR
jgi:2-methylcitrate synthase/citrate synthase II